MKPETSQAEPETSLVGTNPSRAEPETSYAESESSQTEPRYTKNYDIGVVIVED